MVNQHNTGRVKVRDNGYQMLFDIDTLSRFMLISADQYQSMSGLLLCYGAGFASRKKRFKLDKRQKTRPSISFT